MLANKIANEVVYSVDGFQEVYIKILSEIGRRIGDPKVATAQILTNIEKFLREDTSITNTLHRRAIKDG